ncbi:restriction endonuclease subunit S [Staphylococcus saprophyticus]|nr:restriction endonuclease subunit S [Staphylococcus saprophyticus]MBF2782520.1 restriction endonuclease subunit S [Staphylococcus saprophyticus]
MTNEANMPELRFPGFNGKWEIKKLKDIGDIITGKTPSTSNPKFYNGNYPFVSPLDIQNHRFIKKTNKTLSEKGFYSGRIIRKGASLFVCIGSTIGKIGQAGADVITNQQINSLIPYERYDDNFIYSNLLKSSSKIKQLEATQALPIINKETFGSYFINLPQLDEQIKIGNFFNKLDRQIELEEQKLEKLEEQKKGYMQKLFSQELRFKTKDNVYYSEWKLHKLGEIFKYSQGQQISVDKQFSVKSNEMKRFIRIVDITENPEPRFVLYESDTGLVNKEDLFMIRYGRPGIVSIGFEGIIANNLFKLIPKIKISTVYFYYLLSYNYYRINLLTNQSTMPALNFKSLDLLKFKIPSYKEQNKIGNFFTKFDELIEKQSSKIGVLKQRKKGFLQKMFV